MATPVYCRGCGKVHDPLMPCPVKADISAAGKSTRGRPPSDAPVRKALGPRQNILNNVFNTEGVPGDGVALESIEMFPKARATIKAALDAATWEKRALTAEAELEKIRAQRRVRVKKTRDKKKTK